MIAPEEPYGWGILSLPICRGSGTAAAPPLRWRQLTDSLCWRPLLRSASAALVGAATLLLFGRMVPAPPPRPPAPPVDIAYQLPPVPPPEATVPAPVPAPESPPPALRVEIARKDHRGAKKAPEPAPAPPRAAAPPTAETAPLLPPAGNTGAPAAAVDRIVPESPALRKAPPEIDLGPAPSRRSRNPAPADSYRHETSATLRLEPNPAIEVPSLAARDRSPRTAPAAPLPARNTFDRATGPATEIAPPPTAAAPGRHRPATDELPAGATDSVRLLANREDALPVPAAARSEAPRPARPEARDTGSFADLDRLRPADLDRALLVDLSRLQTCRDPGAELALKTRLAALLSRPALCRSNGVIFDVLQPDSAYSVHIDLYNYEQRQFADRCAALRQAVECFEARR